MKKIAVLTTGGDAPGMNAAIRSVVRCAIYNGLKCMGVRRGYAGLIAGEFIEMNLQSVSGIINRGGTILRTVRCPEFKTISGQRKAVKNITENKIDGLIVIGGDGSFHGARCLNTKWKVPTIGIPATIDNDIAGTDYSIGFDTAVNTALDAIDRIRDTAFSHERIFVIEVMGRSRGFLALEVGLAGGAEVVLIPEIKFKVSELIKKVKAWRKRGKNSCIIVVAEGAGRAEDIAHQISLRTGYETRVSVLGHLQRGGTPTVFSRVLGCRLGATAVELLLKGKNTKMVGIVSNKVKVSTIDYAWKYEKKIDKELYKLIDILAI